ncbi:hypothetical protein [Rhodopila sp.]|uniref:hypothetical protein n=1 Tax=Rhodopila sp. TaxID=2480087 RepID=UPI003D148749
MSREVAAIPTGMTGEVGEGGPVIAILGEYDSLPGPSQEAGLTGWAVSASPTCTAAPLLPGANRAA